MEENDVKKDLQKRSSSVYGSNYNAYDDDGFFSDVPLTGSLSKSLIALNKYVKTNLLFETDEDDNETDRAYFSKENSPNDSVSKCDTESIISAGSFDKKEHTCIDTDSNLNDAYSDEHNYINDNFKHEEKDVSSAVIATNENAAHSSSNLLDSLHSVSDKQDKKLDYNVDKTVTNETHLINDLNLSNSVANEYRTDINIQQVPIVHRAKDDNDIPKVLPRKKYMNTQNVENRHSLHDFTTWANRTNIYPDVYAPLPYSTYKFYFF